MFKTIGKGIDYREIGDKFGVSASTTRENVNTAGTDEKLLWLAPVPGHGAQVSARAPTKGEKQQVGRI